MTMMLQILLHNFIGDVARAPRSIPDCPKVPPPILLAQLRILLLHQTRRASLHPFHQIRQALRWRILDVHMHVVFAHYSFQYPHVFGVADLQQQIATPNFDIALQHRITVLRYPYDVRLQARHRVPTVPISLHRPRLLPRRRSV